jgi:hypothetical protein
MAIIANDTQFIGIAPSIDLTGKKSAILNEQTEPVTMADIIETVGGGPSYLVYTALLTQSGTSAPVATVLENTLGGNPVWARGGQGSFNITLSGAFPIGKTIIFLTIRGDDADGRIIAEINYNSSPNANQRGFVFKNASTNLNADGIGTLSSIEIRVYP